MSATNRGSQREVYDRYLTPEHAVMSLLDNHPIVYPALECSTGYGSIQQHLDPDLTWGIDIDPEVEPDQVCNYLKTNFKGKYNTIITNPPYSEAIDFIKKALKDVMPGGQVIFLLRINFLGSLTRQNFWKMHPPSHMYVLSKRPSFMKKGTDATEYAWFVWTKGVHCNDMRINWV